MPDHVRGINRLALHTILVCPKNMSTKVWFLSWESSESNIIKKVCGLGYPVLEIDEHHDFILHVLRSQVTQLCSKTHSHNGMT